MNTHYVILYIVIVKNNNIHNIVIIYTLYIVIVKNNIMYNIVIIYYIVILYTISYYNNVNIYIITQCIRRIHNHYVHICIVYSKE